MGKIQLAKLCAKRKIDLSGRKKDRATLIGLLKLYDEDPEQFEEQERLRKEKEEQERLAREEEERLELVRRTIREEQEKEEQERLEAERLQQERERLEKERMEAERLQQEQERLEAERERRSQQEIEIFEQERLEAERLENERLAAEQQEAERERLRMEQEEQERQERERQEMEELERQRQGPESEDESSKSHDVVLKTVWEAVEVEVQKNGGSLGMALKKTKVIVCSKLVFILSIIPLEIPASAQNQGRESRSATSRYQNWCTSGVYKWNLLQEHVPRGAYTLKP